MRGIGRNHAYQIDCLSRVKFKNVTLKYVFLPSWQI